MESNDKLVAIIIICGFAIGIAALIVESLK